MQTRTIRTLSGDEVTLQVEERNYVAGEFVGSDETFEAENPATQEVIAELPVASSEMVDRAVESANQASLEWREVDVFERRRRVEKLAEAILENRTEITNLDVADNGSSIAKMSDDSRFAANQLRYHAGLASELKGDTIPTHGDTLDYTKREPYGAIGAIIPFNHPALFVAIRIAPAVIAGNGIVLKPSEYTSLSALYIARLIDDLDIFPSGLINVVTGAGEVGSQVVEHPGIGMVAMIGSVPTGKKVMEGAASHLAPVLLELGGKNPTIVFPDADPEEAAQGAVDGMALSWQGQSCGSGTRLFVHDDVYDDVVPRVVEKFEETTIGDPFKEDTEMGSIVSKPQYERVLEYLETADDEGATTLTGGGPVEEFDTGYFVHPTVYEVDSEMTVAQEEIFGPVLSVMSWNDYDEMMETVNSVDYGLTASIWTENITVAHEAAEDVEAGYVWINQHGTHYPGAPFGGYKNSGIGRNECIEELLDHTRVKNVNVQLGRDTPY